MSSIKVKKLSQEDLEQITESLKRCPKGTLEAAIAYRETRDPVNVSIIVMGILERFLEPDLREKLSQKDVGDLSVLDDLGVDSLTMVEIVMLVEETLNVSIDNDDLRVLRTINDINRYLECKIKGVSVPKAPVHIPITDIIDILPHQPPFLFLQEASCTTQNAVASYRISGDEFFFEGHFKNNPVFPASIMLESLGQLAVLYILKSINPIFIHPRNSKSIYFTSCNGVRVQRICRPGDILKMTIRPKKIRHPLAIFEGFIKVNGEKVAYAEEICLTFDYKKTKISNLG